MLTPLHRSDGNGVGDQPRFEAGLDDEQAAETLQHWNSLSTEHASGGFSPFPA
jgi:hypothetical protein